MNKDNEVKFEEFGINYLKGLSQERGFEDDIAMKILVSGPYYANSIELNENGALKAKEKLELWAKQSYTRAIFRNDNVSLNCLNILSGNMYINGYKGLPIAQCYLGDLYSKGVDKLNIKQDDKKANEFYTSAVKQGD